MVINQTASIVQQLSDERRKVDFDSYDMSVQQLLSMVAQEQIDVAPTYQRRFRWDPKRQSQLIESIFLGIPVPNLFMATNQDGTWEVVDGVQRLSTIVHFAGDERTRKVLRQSDSLVVQELEKLTELNSCRFGELALSVQTQFLLRPLKITTLNDKSDLKVRFDLFERLNTGGVRLTDQEIRGCIYRGTFNEFLEDLSKNRHFNKVVFLTKAMQEDGTREEFVLRFFAFLNRYRQFDHSVVEFLNDYMASATKSFDFERGRAEFERTFASLARAVPSGIRRRTKVTPVNLFEAVAVGAALALRSAQALARTDVSSWMNSDDLKATTTAGANSKKAVRGRIEFARDRFLG